ncbi:TonB-dependent receptor [Granulicella tundricola]|uniref:TonB-dependent receptor plug n=1 Tax=Granulicella tundricola (strain ATCC BAA-1859 / DSM 23138 / MP5ACTX9) TaxID=1198114 RepID=E8X5N2_GRATM|nr:carboxypeptidase regulatory-like domain-containing protein [Granulicella tundricola]ADW70659.1 TonB-dependent receptor plug [Granulicella tundricola MP5ACTX9]
MKLSPALRRATMLGIFAASLTAAHAADVNARIKGTVTDPAGAVIPNVKVIAINQATGVKFTTTSQANGDYLFPQLPIGTYTISASATGFKGFAAKGIVLNIDQEYVEPVKLDLGSASETISVQADAVQVNTTDMQLNNIVNADQFVELPLIGRAFTNLEQILPGVQASNDRFGSFSVNGSQTQQSSYLINGADSNDIALNTIGIQPNLDALAQFNLVTGPLNAEYDRNSGAVVSTVIKQGTNQFHGDAFDFYRDTFLNTKNYFQTKASKYHQNIYGGTLGGPIIKDKLFAFFAFQGQKAVTPQTGGNVTVLSPANLTGDFSADLNPTSANAFQANPVPGTLKAATGCTLPGETWTQCFPTGKIPTTAFNPVSLNLIKAFLPAANTGTNGFQFNPVTTQTQRQYIGRMDFNPTAANQFYFVAIQQHFPSSDVLPFTGGTVPGFGDQNTSEIYQYSAGFIRQLSSSSVNNLEIHYTRFNFGSVSPQNVVQPSTLGFSITPQNAAAASVPFIGVTGFFNLGFSTNGPQPRKDQNYQADDNFSKVVGHHNLKFGYDGRRYNVSNPFFSNNNGAFSFNSATNIFTTGDASLDFLLGNPSTYAQGSGAQINAYAFLNYMYAQDTWKATNSLTISYGIGYQIDTPLHNTQYNNEGVTCFIPGQQSKVFTTAPIGLNYPSDPGCNNASGATTRYTNFGPRFGFAYAPDFGFLSGGSAKKLSVRGGFGVYYNRSEEETSLNNLGDAPYGLNSSGAADYGATNPTFANPYQDLDTGTVYKNKFPATFATAGQTPDFSPFEPLSLSQYSPNFRSPYSENFQLTVERELPSQTIARLSYVGTLGRHNQFSVEGNPVTAAGHAACLASAACITNRNIQSYVYPTHTQFGVANASTGFNNFTSIGTVTTEGASSYHALQASVEKGLTHGLLVQASYTYSHSLDNGSSYEGTGYGGTNRGYNQYQPSLNYGDSNFDARHRFVFSPLYRVPFKSGGNAFSLRNLAASGWEVSGVSTFATGFPFDISYGGGTSRSLWCSASFSYYACPDVPNQIAPLVRANDRTRSATTGYTTWFSPASFAAEPIGAFGNVHRNPYHGPGLLNTNIIVAKNISVSSDSTRYFQLRLESDNVFNHTQFSNPDGNIGDSTFGQITSAAAGRQTQLAGKFYF